uniref:DNA ligase (NAD(+)) n=1 Tax=viral metagenome TaxID=1070528 RepID=A0A6C0BS01_9ZZZZ
MKTRKRRIKRIKLKTKRYLQKFKDKITIKRMKGSGEKENKKTLKNKANATVMKYIKSFRTEGAEVLKKMREKTLQNILEASRDSYYNDDPLITDNEYDIIKEYMEVKYPKNIESTVIGADVKVDKVKLPYFMGSMDKIKPDTNAIDNWKKDYSGPYVLSTKLDGVSGLYSTENDEAKLYTRGNGKVGQDVSKFIGKLNMPEPSKIASNIVVRGEFIIRKDIFKVYYGADFANSRNFVSGVINSKSPSAEKLNHVDFVAYELIKPVLKPSDQYKFMSEQGFIVAKNELHPNVSNEILSDILVSWRNDSEYEMDGIICCDDNIYPRIDGNPDFAFAFKMVLGDQIAEAKVLAVEWSPSKDGLLKPRIRIEPINLGGTKIEYATAFNAAFVMKNKLGVGAKIKIIRSGDVIPYIMDVLEPAEHIMMPSEEYEWYGDTETDIVLKNKGDSKEVKIKNIEFFFDKLDVDGLGEGNIKRILDAGYDTVPKIINMSLDDFKGVFDTKGGKLAPKIHANIHKKLDEVELVDLMAASNLFGHGMGSKRMLVILEDYPDVLTSNETDNEKVEKMIKIKGVARKTAELFVSNINEFLTFLDEINMKKKLEIVEKKSDVNTGHVLYKKSIVMSGFRDDELNKKLNKVGANLTSAVSKNTFAVIVKDLTKITGKVEKAKEKGVKIFDKEGFINEYF